jgi:glutamate formiminotransferase/formiminotetrahydrofolate cyclodeaminase
MTQRIIECIPNFSEGRRLEVIEAIQASIAQIPGVYVLDRHTDIDHNRSVITFSGPPEAVADAAYSAIATAAQLIDLEKHQGEHPRIGATDVVPFVPLIGTTIDDCVQVANQLGKRVGEELGIPVYLYEQAATRPDRVNLEDIRRGEYEKLKETIGVDPNRVPDYGPTKIGPAGAVVIGARQFLIAYNVYLTTDNIEIAKMIARAIRFSSGGLRYVKALGLLVHGRAQVSMNLTDFTRTPLARVVETIRRETARYGVGIHHSELVGLIPQAALVNAAQWYLQLDQFQPDQVLETRLYAAMEKENMNKSSFIEMLAAGTPTPGGGSAAAYAGAMGAALVAMVARLTLGKKKYAKVQKRMEKIILRADELRGDLENAVDLDAQAFDAVMDAFRLPKETQAEKDARTQAIQHATHQAATVPLQVARQAVEVMTLAAEVAETGNINAASDAGSAGALAHASLEGAGMNVKINAGSISDRVIADKWLKELDQLKEQAQTARERLHTALEKRASLEI